MYADKTDKDQTYTGHVDPASAPKLTQWVSEPDVGKLTEDLEAAKPAQAIYIGKIQKWNDLLNITGKAKPTKIKGHSAIQPRLIRRQAEWRYSALSEPFNSSDKLFDISPRTFEDANAARQNQLVINWQFSTKINRVNFIDHYVRANVDEGSAIVRLGWCRYTKEITEEVPVYDHIEPSSKADIDQLEAANLLRSTDPRQYKELTPPAIQAALEYFDESGMPTVAVQNGTQKVTTEKVLDNRPLLEVMNPQNVFVDPSCGYDLEKSGFVIVSFETSQAEMLKEPKRYKNLKFVNWEAASTAVMTADHVAKSKDTNFNYKDPLRKRIVAYEYWGVWDIHGTGELVPIVATWIGGILVRLEENPFPDGKPPFVIANYMPVKRELMGEPDAELLGENQAVLGAVTRGMIDLLGRSANGQQGFAKGMLDVLNRRRYEDGQDYEFNPNMPPSQGMIEHKYPEIPNSAMIMLQSQNAEAEALTGVKSFSGGISGEAFGDVAAGIRGVLDAASKREMAILRRLANGLVTIGKKLCAMNAVFLSEEETIRITNTDFVTVKREELAGDFDLKVDISTAEIDNNKAQDLAFMLQTMGNNMDFGITKMVLTEIARLKRMPELAQKIETFEPKPDPLAEQMKQLELQEKMKQIELLDSEIALNKAKVEKTMVEADATDLDITEQETGTKHARDMEKTGGQAAANQSLEITKALVKPKKNKDGSESKPDIEAAAGWNELSKRMNDPRRASHPDVPAPGPNHSVGSINTINGRNGMVETDPRFSIASQEFQPELDPALNPAINL